VSIRARSDYKAELVVDGRTLPRPVNYILARIIPPVGVEIDRVGRAGPHRHAEADAREVNFRAAAIRFAAASSSRPSRDRITTSAATPFVSWAPIVCDPVPCDAPDPVVTLVPLVRWNSGSSCS
jgi:Protein of unknown function (DUF3141)